MNLPDFIAHLDVAEEQADGWLARCPTHDDSHASLKVSIGRDGRILAKCRAGCDTRGVIQALGVEWAAFTAIRAARDEAPVPRMTGAPVAASPAAVASLAMRLDGYNDALAEYGTTAVEYARERFGLTDDDMLRLGLGYADDLGGGPRLVVPFRTPDGVPRNFQARALSAEAMVRWQGPKSPDGGSWSKLGYFPGDSGWAEVLICEGPGDALTASALGYDAIAIAGASHAGNAAVVDEVAAWVGDREAVVAGDGDAAGRAFSSKLANGLVARGVRVRVLDLADGLDLTDWRAQAGASFPRDAIRAIASAHEVTDKTAALLEWDPARYSPTDLGGARYLRDYIANEGSGVKYTPEAGFLLLDRGVWRIDTRQAVRTYAQQVADKAQEVVATGKAGAELYRYAKHAQTTRGIDSMIRELQALSGVPASLNDFDQHPDLLAVENGVVDLRTGELRPHDPELLLSRRLDIAYDQAAQAPRWEAFLAEVFPRSAEMPAWIQRLVGYGLTGHTAEQCFVIHLGGGANGKSVFLDTLTEVFREVTTTTPFSTFEVKPSGGIPNDLAALKGARLVMASEGEQGKRMAEAVLKRVTGRDLISARFMRQEFFEFRPSFLLQLATNFEPGFRGQDEGLWRRVKLVKWERYFEPHERDGRLPDRLREEAAGILAWAVRGARDWYSRGLQDPPFVSEASRQYRATSDILQGFLPGLYVHADEADGSKAVLGKLLWDDFRTWAEEQNLRDLQQWSQRAFYGALKERGLTQKRVAQGQAFYGVRRADRLRDAPDEATPRSTPTTPPAAPPSQAAQVAGASLDDLPL